MTPFLLVCVYCLFIVGASLLGGWLPTLVRLTHTRIQFMMSFVSGLMLGVSLLHMVPHAAAQVELDRVVLWMLAGVLVMFMLIRLFHIHQHAPDENHGHDHSHGQAHPLSFVGVAIGLALHTAIDGVALAAAVAAESHSGHGHGVALLGVGTFAAVLLHKPLDALAITSLMSAGGWSPTKRQLVHAGFALMCPLGAALFFFGIGDGHSVFVGSTLAFSAGVFLCIALADLLPEIQFHSHDRLLLFGALLLGVVLAWAIGFLEPGELHSG